MLRWFLLLLVTPTVACGEDRFLVEFKQDGRANVRLNEKLEFFFSEEILPISVSTDSFRIWDDTGARPKERAIKVDSNRIIFEPALANSPDLKDGGFLPSTTYHVELAGGLQKKAIRSRSGNRLAHTSRFSFRTASIDETSVYIDGTLQSTPRAYATRPDGTRVVSLMSQIGGLVRAGGPLVVDFDQNLDPRTVVPESFQLFHLRFGKEKILLGIERVTLCQGEKSCRVTIEPKEAIEVNEYYVVEPTEVKNLGGVCMDNENCWVEFMGAAFE